MRTIQIRFLSITALAVLALTGSAIAQEKPSAVLNSLEMQQLVERAEPADSARLAAHFAALADRYAAEAKRHTSMAQSYVGNQSRSTQTGLAMSMHCKRLSDLNTQSATELRDLATYYQKLASGVAAPQPAAGSRFEGGAGGLAPTEDDLGALAAKATTPADHRVLQEYFLTLAQRYNAEAKEHTAYAVSWRGSTRVPTAAVTAAHCEKLAGQLRDSAKEATAAAEMHKRLANVAR